MKPKQSLLLEQKQEKRRKTALWLSKSSNKVLTLTFIPILSDNVTYNNVGSHLKEYIPK